MVRDEVIGKLYLRPPLHELQVQPARWAPGHDCMRAWQYAQVTSTSAESLAKDRNLVLPAALEDLLRLSQQSAR